MTLLLMAFSAIHHRCFRTSLPILCAMTRHLFSYILPSPPRLAIVRPLAMQKIKTT